MLFSSVADVEALNERIERSPHGSAPEWVRQVADAEHPTQKLLENYQYCLLGADILTGIAAFVAAALLLPVMDLTEMRLNVVAHVSIFVPCWMLMAFVMRHYTLSLRSPLMRIGDMISVLTPGTIAGIAITYMLNPMWLTFRLYYVLAFAIGVMCYAATRAITAAVIPEEYVLRLVAVMGTGEESVAAVRHLTERSRGAGYRVVGLVQTEGEPVDVDAVDGYPVIASLADCPGGLFKHYVNTLIFPQSGALSEMMTRSLARCDAVGIDVMRFEAAYEGLTKRAALFHTGQDWLARLESVRYNKYATRLKRLLDITVTLCVLPIAAAIIGLCALLIKVFSPGPVFYSQVRVGKDGRYFRFTKLRTMVCDAEKNTGPVWAKKDDPRVTPLGRILRKLRLDELPQLWHVLTGHMSLVGPRPERPAFVNRFAQEIPLYERRLSVSPGITGWAQINHRYDTCTDDVIEKLRYDLYYVRNVSAGLDLQILFRTIGVMLGRKGAQ